MEGSAIASASRSRGFGCISIPLTWIFLGESPDTTFAPEGSDRILTDGEGHGTERI